MTTLRTVAGNTILLSIAHIVNPLTSILLVSSIARIEGAAVLGQYSLVLTMFYMAANLAGLGLNIPITREVAKDRGKAPEYFVISTAIGTVTAFAAIGAVQILVYLLDYTPQVRSSVGNIMWAVLPCVLINFYEAIFIAFHKAKEIAAVTIVENICKVIIGFALLAAGKGITAIIFLIVILRFLAFLSYLLLYRLRVGMITARFNWAIFKKLCQLSPVFTTNLLVGDLFGRVDVILLSKLASLTEVGYYSAALRIIEIARMVPNSFMRASFPAICDTLKMDYETNKRFIVRSIAYMIIYGVCTALGIFLLSDLVIHLLYGPLLGEAKTILQTLSVMMLPISIYPVLAALLVATNQQLLDLQANIARIVVLLALCVFLIPSWNVIGAAIALIVSEVVMFYTLLAFVKRDRFHGLEILQSLRWPVLAAGLALLVHFTVPIESALFRVLIALTMFVIVMASLDANVKELFVFVRSLRGREKKSSLHG